MEFTIEGKSVFASTGGRQHRDNRAWILFIHGAGQSHLTWSQQSRSFAYDGYNVLSLDLPAHGSSEGPALGSIGEMANWIIKVMDSLNIEQAHLVNHSMGGLISLEVASQKPERVASVSFLGTAMTIAVGEVLVEWSRHQPDRAIAFMTGLGLSSFGHKYDSSVPGVSLIGSGLQIMNMNDDDGLSADLVACVEYGNGAAAAAKIKCKCLSMVASMDKMVAPKFGRMLHDALENSELYELPETGHMIPAERPREVNGVLREFLLTI